MSVEVYEEVIDAEIVCDDPEEFDTRFQSALGSYADARQELIDCIEYVRSTDVAEQLGFSSRGDYIADRVAGLNVKWAIEDRRSLVELMAHDPDGGMSTRQIGNALGVNFNTVARDVRSVSNDTDEPRKVQSSDGITRTYEAKTEPSQPKATPLPRQFSGAVVELGRVLSRFRRISNDKNFNAKNRESISEVHLSDIDRAIEQLTELRNQLEKGNA